jgi:hypothetical protein
MPKERKLAATKEISFDNLERLPWRESEFRQWCRKWSLIDSYVCNIDTQIEA